jgi:hypothetical protein
VKKKENIMQVRIPGEIDLSVYGDPVLSAVLARGQYRECSDAELKAGLVELEKLIGKKLAASPGWLRRFCVIRSTGNIGCVVTHCRQAMHPDAPWVDSDDTHPVPLALPMASAVALLASEKNPEIEWQRRQRLCDEFYAGQDKKQKENRARQDAEAAAVRRANKERLDFKAIEWAALSPLQRLILRFALAVADRDPKLAADLRGALNAETADTKGANFPRGQWWEGFAVDAA